MRGRPGRPEKSFDATAGPVAAFAQGLRDLRRGAGLTYAEMAERAHFSPSTLSLAASGNRLPSEEVARAFVRVCGGDEKEWAARWRAACDAVPGAEPTAAGMRGVRGASSPHPVPLRREPTSFVGRQDDVASVCALLGRARLVTLTGGGGVGKTRLAFELLPRVSRSYPDGVHVVELADLADPALVPSVVASAFHVTEVPGGNPVRVLADELSSRTPLLVLDNCEHLRGACAALVYDLLRAVPGMSVLATSRQALGVQGECVARVDPLVLPARDVALDAGAVHRYSALHLFADRAESLLPGFRISEAEIDDVADVCRRLDGMPLAIELVVRWLRSLTVRELSDRLGSLLALTPADDPVAPRRHRTMHSVLAWSHDLCTPAEKAAWACVSLAPGTVPLSLAEALARTPGSAHPLETVSRLVDKSIFIPVSGPGPVRYQLPETVRAFGRAALSEQAEKATRARYLSWCHALATGAEADWYGPHQVDALNRVRGEHHHVRAALSDSSSEHARTRMEIASSLWLYWIACGRLDEGRRYLEKSLAENRVRDAAGARARWTCGFICLLQGESKTAATHLAEAEESATALGLTRLHGRVAMLRGLALLFRKELDASLPVSRHALTVSEASDDPLTTVLCLGQIGLAHALLGDTEEAHRRYAQAESLTRSAGERWHLSYVRWCAGMLHLQTGDAAEAATQLRLCLRTKHSFADRVGAAAAVEILSWAACELGEPRTAARLLGAAQAIRPEGNASMFDVHHLVEAGTRWRQRMQNQLGKELFTELFERGARLTPSNALEFSLSVPVPQPDRAPRDGSAAAPGDAPAEGGR